MSTERGGIVELRESQVAVHRIALDHVVRARRTDISRPGAGTTSYKVEIWLIDGHLVTFQGNAADTFWARFAPDGGTPAASGDPTP
jgi:hypothetical protein